MAWVWAKMKGSVFLLILRLKITKVLICTPLCIARTLAASKTNKMPRPKSKKELLELSQANYNKLLELINLYSKTEVEKEFPVGTLNRNIKDVLAHLHEWHVMMLGWYKVGMKGEKPDMPTKGYTWRTLPELNREIWKKYKDIELKTAKELLDKSYNQIQNVIKKHSNEELFEKKRYKWTGSTSLGAYLVSNSSSHYDWAIKLIKKSIK